MDADNKKPVDANAEPAAKGINWLTIFGWAVLAILVVIIFYVLYIYKQAQENPLIQAASRMEPYITEMKEKTRSQIEEMSQFVDASAYESIDEPMTAYYPFADAYVQVEGQVSKDMTQNVAANIAGNVMTTDESYGAYVLNNNIVVIDIEKGYQELAEGTTLSGCGRILIVKMDDIWELPIIGPDLKQEFEGIKDMPEGVVFLISKEVKIKDEPKVISEEPAPMEEVDPDAMAVDAAEGAETLLGPDPEEPVEGDTETEVEGEVAGE